MADSQDDDATRDNDGERPSLFDHAALAPPWRDALPNGTGEPTYDEGGNLIGLDLGPEYGPTSYVTGEEVSPARAQQEFAESRDAIGSGGLIDHTRLAAGSSPSVPPRLTRAEKAKQDRYDRRQVLAYIDAHSTKMGKRLLEVGILYWEHKVSVGQVGLRLGIKSERVWELVKQMRSLVHPRGTSGKRAQQRDEKRRR